MSDFLRKGTGSGQAGSDFGAASPNTVAAKTNTDKGRNHFRTDVFGSVILSISLMRSKYKRPSIKKPISTIRMTAKVASYGVKVSRIVIYATVIKKKNKILLW